MFRRYGPADHPCAGITLRAQAYSGCSMSHLLYELLALRLENQKLTISATSLEALGKLSTNVSAEGWGEYLAKAS